ncbi:hypothetical protein EDD11_004117, partial [Mortierella claussenii]
RLSLSILTSNPHASLANPPHKLTALDRRHHRRSVDRVWPPALEIKLAQWKMQDTTDHLQLDPSERPPNYLDCSSCSSSHAASHVIPMPPPRTYSSKSDRDEHYLVQDDLMEDERAASRHNHHRSRRERGPRRRASCVYPSTPLNPPSYPRNTISIEYKRQCKATTRSSLSTPHTPATHPLEVLHLVDRMHPFDAVVSSGNIHNNTSQGENGDDQHDSSSNSPYYTPESISQASTPHWFTHYSSTATSITSTGTSTSSAIIRRESDAKSPQTFRLLGFLARHSNGHIMYRKPTNCSIDCSDASSYASRSSLSGSDNDDDDDGETTVGRSTSLRCSALIAVKTDERATENDDDDSDQDEQLDDRFLLLAQSPNSSEFEFGDDFFMTENQMNASKHQADSPVFFNGFPLLRMTPMD